MGRRLLISDSELDRLPAVLGRRALPRHPPHELWLLPRPHAFRHTYAQTLADQGWPLRCCETRRAGVSVSLMYADSGLGARIANARDCQRQAGTEPGWWLPHRSLITEQSLRAELANAKEHARCVAEEVTLLRGRFDRQFGAATDIVWVSPRSPSSRPSRTARRRAPSRQPT